jgi:uncharacterized protein YjbI with pentapeptide repeats
VRVWISKFLRSPVFLMVIGGVATLVLLLVVVWLLWRTGGAKAVSDNAAVIGALVALGGVFTAQMVSIALEDQRTRETRALEDQRSQDAALQAYFEQMGGLLTEHNLLHTDREYIRQLAEAQTLTVVARLDGSRKRSLMRFLHEAGLINKDEPTVGLSGADLRLAELSGADLSDADLNGADLSNASLKRARLCGTDLSSADLFEARGWTADQLRATRTLEGATMPDGQILQGAAVPNGPTLEEWLKSQGLGEAGEYE